MNVGPVAGVRIVEGRGGLVIHLADPEKLAVRICYQGHNCRGIADQGEHILVQLRLAVDGVALWGVGVLHIPVEGAAVRIEHRHAVGVGDARMGGPDLLAVVGLGEGHVLIHGRVGPIAVEAKDRDGVLRTGHSLWGAQTRDQNIALHISAVGIGLVQSLLLGLGQGHFHANLHLLTGLHRDQSGAVPGQEQMYVIGIDGAVAVQIRFVSAGDGRAIDDIVHQSLAVGHVDFPVAVEVQTGQRLRQRQSRAVRSPGGADLQSLRLGVQIGFSILPEGSLGEEVGAEPVGQGLVGDVLQGEGEAVAALSIRVVSQLGLYLAVRCRVGGVFVH